MNLQRMTELLQSKGWVEVPVDMEFDCPDFETQYEGWEICILGGLTPPIDGVTVLYLRNVELDAEWYTVQPNGLRFSRYQLLYFRNFFFDFAEKTIRDTMREYHQSPGQISLNLSI